jgi:lipopolysaccharide/colanic/teichoic acid biosynthesis glycosyltransferase
LTHYTQHIEHLDHSPATEFFSRPAPIAFWTTRFKFFKKICDISFGLAALPIMGGIAIVLFVVNPLVNRGPVFFRQERMGLGGKKIMLWKFRTMTVSATKVRAADAPLETERVTPLGKFLRQTRIDELPNFINVLRGDMSVVGPRPDAWDHARLHIDEVQYYSDRFRVLPGITGLAQVRGGYADCRRATERKARLDLFYVRRSRIKLDLLIIRETIVVMCTGFGAK